MRKKDKNYFLERLNEFLRIRSISADPRSTKEMQRAVNFLARELKELGFSVKTFGQKRPTIYAKRLTDPKLPTLLIYGHYDVQPPDPLELWKTPPFEPSIRQGKIFARGASDDKGQLYTHLAAIRLLTQENVTLPNIKFLIEGEEEVAGEIVEKVVNENLRELKANLCVISDSGFMDKETPSIEISTRGIVYYELRVTSNKQDLHSGIYGGAVYNPLNVIAKVTRDLEQRFGVKKLIKVPKNSDYSSFDINGISGGFQGEGQKTVIPSTAMVKFSVRLTPKQRSAQVAREVESMVKKSIPKGVKYELKLLGSGEGFATSGKSKYFRLAMQSMEKAFGKIPELTKSGGSLPIVSSITKITPNIIFMGYGLVSDNLHSPNEKLDLDQFFRGIECNMDFLKRLSKLQ